MPEEHREDPGKALKERSLQEFAERTKGKPTPTQDELDRANMGEHVVDKEPDGADPDPGGQPGGIPADMSKRSKTSTAAPSQSSYATRQATPKPPGAS